MRKDSVLLVCVVTSMVSSAAAFLLLWSLNIHVTPTEKAIVVPTLAGIELSQARQALTRVGLKLKVEQKVQHAKIPAGNIVNQIPAAGSPARPGMAVRVVVSTGKRTLKMPTLAGLPVTTALQVVASTGLKPGEVSRKHSDTVDKDVVISSLPGEGETVAEGGQVNLVVSLGPDQVEVPRVTGQRRAKVAEILKAAGFELGRVRHRTDEDRSPGIVLSQSPKAGAKVNKGTAVDIVINFVE